MEELEELEAISNIFESAYKFKRLSVPYQLFIDGFGLYRNMYRSIMGIYMIAACLSESKRDQYLSDNSWATWGQFP